MRNASDVSKALRTVSQELPPLTVAAPYEYPSGFFVGQEIAVIEMTDDLPERKYNAEVQLVPGTRGTVLPPPENHPQYPEDAVEVQLETGEAGGVDYWILAPVSAPVEEEPPTVTDMLVTAAESDYASAYEEEVSSPIGSGFGNGGFEANKQKAVIVFGQIRELLGSLQDYGYTAVIEGSEREDTSTQSHELKMSVVAATINPDLIEPRAEEEFLKGAMPRYNSGPTRPSYPHSVGKQVARKA